MKGKSESEVILSGPTLCDPMDCSLPGSSVCRILQARILEWVVISFSIWKIIHALWTEEAGGLLSIGLHSVEHD